MIDYVKGQVAVDRAKFRSVTKDSTKQQGPAQESQWSFHFQKQWLLYTDTSPLTLNQSQSPELP